MELQLGRVTVRSFGTVQIAASKSGLLRVHFGDDALGFRSDLKEDFPGAVLKDGGAQAWEAAKAIRRYLEGGPDPRVPVVLPEDGFSARVWHEIGKIPRGEVRSYARIAKALRKPNATRAVGQACGRNPVPLVVPCHRVVASDGTLGGFGGGLHLKRKLLELEGFRLH
jgi:O-6-methylguanine DNA methyltransferase